MNKIFIWLDDEREVPNYWKAAINRGKLANKIFRNAEDLIKWYAENLNEYEHFFISFDHDLGSGMTGYDMAKYIVEHKLPVSGFASHSMNPVGRKNIITLLSHYGYKEMKYTSDILK